MGGHSAFSDGLESFADDLAGVDDGQKGRRVSATMIMVRGSPVYTPEIFPLAAQKLGTAPAHTLVLEDSFNGVRAKRQKAGFLHTRQKTFSHPLDKRNPILL